MWSYFLNWESESGTILFLVLCIFTFLLTSLVAFFLLIRSRRKKIREERTKATWIPLIDELLFKVVFEEPLEGKAIIDFLPILRSKPYDSLMKNKAFRDVLLENTILLHANYSGMYSARLEAFYREAGLIDRSLGKLQSKKWHRQCEGIRELSQMRVVSAVALIRNFIHSKNQTLKLEAFVGVVRLEGLNGMVLLTHYKSAINDWIQLNIFFELKLTDQTDVPDFGHLLESDNPSVVVFAMRLIANYHQHKHAMAIAMIAQKSKDKAVKREAIATLEVFEHYHNPQ